MLIHVDAMRVVEAPLSAAWTARLIVVRVAFARMFVGLGMSEDGVEGERRYADDNDSYKDRDPLNLKEVADLRWSHVSP
jgi:hypothetical protein